MSLNLMKAEIERKKRERELVHSALPGAGEQKVRKWVRRGAIEEARRRAEEGESPEKEAGSQAGADEQNAAGEQTPNSMAENANDTPDVQRTESPVSNEAQAKPPMSKDEVIKRLRAMAEPATLFGEGDMQRYLRLKEVGLRKDDTAKGQRNVFQIKMRQMQGEQDAEDVYLEQRDKLEGALTTSAPDDTLMGVEPTCDEDFVRQEISRLLLKWKAELDSIPAHERKTQKARHALATYEQSKEYIAPLMKKLRKQQLATNVLTPLAQIFKYVDEKEYVKANDVYLSLAIGNSPWPMGATMVGIHARSAREKIGEGKIAHVMNDEQTRKYIQAVKAHHDGSDVETDGPFEDDSELIYVGD